MKKKNLILIIIVLILLMILIPISIIKSIKKTTTEGIKELDTNNFYKYDTSKKISICKTDDCKIPHEIDYDLLKVKYNIPELNKVVEKINNDTLNYMEKTNKSNLNGSECEKVKSLYTKRNITISFFTNYENNKYISIAVIRQHRDLCTNTITNDNMEVYIYDKNQKKILSIDEFRQQEQITDEVINNSINNFDPNGEYNIIVTNNTKLYYSSEGNIMIYVQDSNNKYHDIEIIK